MAALVAGGFNVDVWVTSVSISPQAVFNVIWYVAEAYGFVPDRVYLIWNEGVARQLETVKELVDALSRYYGKSVEVVADESVRVYEEDIEEFRSKVGQLLKSLNAEKKGRIVVDITPGRKFMSSLLLAAGMTYADHVVYLLLRDLSYMNNFLFHIPFSLQKLIDLKSLFKSTPPLSGERAKGERGKVFITRRDVMCVLNSLYLDNKLVHDLKVKNQVIGRLSLKLKKNEALFKPHLGSFFDEAHGDSSLIREVVLASGMARFANEEEAFKEVLDRVTGGGRTVYVGFDTNSLIFRAPSKLMELLEREYAQRKAEMLSLNFTVSDEVLREVSRNVNQKLPFDPKLGEYSNQLTPKARLFMIAQGELQTLNKRNYEVASSDASGKSGDEKIALDYKSFAAEKGDTIVFTTDDAAFIAMENYVKQGVIPVKLEHPQQQESYVGRWDDARDLLYYLSTVLGEISIPPYKLKGVWGGKNARDWRQERLALINFEYKHILDVNAKL